MLKNKCKRAWRWFLGWLSLIFWKRPTDRPLAKEVIHQFVCIKYHGQWINLNKTLNEHLRFNSLSRFDKRAMAIRFKILESKGMLKFQEVEGVMTCVKTEKGKLHENQENFSKQRSNRA